MREISLVAEELLVSDGRLLHGVTQVFVWQLVPTTATTLNCSATKSGYLILVRPSQ